MSKPNPHSTVELRKMNRNRVFRALYHTTQPLTKQDLAYQLSMSLPTLTQNLSELMAMGLVDNSETAGSSGGRKPRILSVVPGARWALGVEISSRHIRTRIMTYLSAEAVRSGGREIVIPFNRQQMAGYLNVDRSALSRELGKMQEEGILEFRKNRFRLI